MNLTVRVITALERHAAPFLVAHVGLCRRIGAQLVVAVDRADPTGLPAEVVGLARVRRVRTNGNVTPVLNALLPLCGDGYVLSLDDDGCVSPAMERWLAARSHETEPVWQFPTAHLWEAGWWITDPPLGTNRRPWLTTVAAGLVHDKLHTKPLAGRGAVAPVMLEHHKFLVKPRAERAARIQLYESLEKGGGLGHRRLAYGLPEEYYRQTGVTLAPLGDGTVREYEAHELRKVAVC